MTELEQAQDEREESCRSSGFRIVFRYTSLDQIQEQGRVATMNSDPGGGDVRVGRTSLLKREC